MKQESKTVREWLMTLPDGYRDRAIANMERECPEQAEVIESCFTEAISGAFTWMDTPEGSVFWIDVKNGNFPPLPQ
jgi:DNA-binding transcriptional MocR family regulator